METRSSESGFSLIELLVATCVFLIITGVVMSALQQMITNQTTVWNRTEMHSGVRGATELMQQEVGQAGRVAAPAAITLNGAVAAAPACDQANPGTNAVTVGVSSVAGLWATAGAVPASYALITTLDGASRETVPLWSVTQNPPQITACFLNAHLPGTTMMVLGAFANGIVPPTVPNGSTANVMKMFGDVNGDGNMVYVEYTCDATVTHKLYRNTMAYNATAKPALANALVLLNNVEPNPGGTPCFTYQTSATNPPLIVQGQPVVFVLDVAITLTVQTQQLDPTTKQYQTETKALLNVSPRNVFNAWELAGMGYTDHIQSTPATVTALLGM